MKRDKGMKKTWKLIRRLIRENIFARYPGILRCTECERPEVKWKDFEARLYNIINIFLSGSNDIVTRYLANFILIMKNYQPRSVCAPRI